MRVILRKRGNKKKTAVFLQECCQKLFVCFAINIALRDGMLQTKEALKHLPNTLFCNPDLLQIVFQQKIMPKILQGKFLLMDCCS